jgi:5-methylthioribose kinase
VSPETFLISPETLPGYLARHGLVPEGGGVSICALGGGVSNLVLEIASKDPCGREQRWVVKQSLEKLRVKDDWRSERRRIFREAESIRVLRPLLGPKALPEIIHIDRENFLFIMTAAPAGSVVWKESLLKGSVESEVARQAGKLLAGMINASRRISQLRENFDDRKVFDQLRIDPYYRTTAARHPDVAPALMQLIEDSWKIRTGLVHGDYSPKNMLVRGTNVFLIDFEVIHWGDPAFDSGFLLNHLFLKALYQPEFASAYFDAAREFWRALGSELENEAWPSFESMTIRHLAGLMLARIDGKSPVEYIRDEATQERVRAVAKRLLREPPQRLEEVIKLTERYGFGNASRKLPEGSRI